MKDCTTCKYGYEDERLGIRMCHHPKRFSEDCINFNMHEEKETEVEHANGSSEILNNLEEAAKKHAHCPFTDDDGNFHEDAFDVNAYHDFIAGAEWQKEQYHFFNEAWADDMQYQLNRNYENGKQAMKEQMMKEAMDGKVVNDGGEYQLIIPALRTALSKIDEGDKVRIIIVKEDGK